MTPEYLEEMVHHYVEALLWSSTDDEGMPLDNTYTESDLLTSARNQCRRDCKAFLVKAEPLLEGCSADARQVGHDFWLTRNGHGVGFWGRPELYRDRHTADALSELARVFGECYPSVTSKGRVAL